MIIDKIMKRFDMAVYLKQIDAIRPDYCVEMALKEMQTSCDMVYNIHHDPGETGKVFVSQDSEAEEPV